MHDDVQEQALVADGTLGINFGWENAELTSARASSLPFKLFALSDQLSEPSLVNSRQLW